MRAILLALAACLWLSGCGSSIRSNYHPVEELQPVQTVGIDAPGQGLEMSISSLRGQNGAAAILTGRGETVEAAAAELGHWAAREELFFPHTRFLLLGRSAAEGHLEEIFRWFAHSGRACPELPVFLLRNGTARELIAGAGEGDYEITRTLEALQRQERRPLTLTDVLRQLRRTGAAVCPAVESAALSGHVPTAAEGALTARDAGYALLRPGTAVFLTEEESLGTALLLSHTDSIRVPLPQGAARVSPERLRCRWEGNTVRITLDYTARVPQGTDLSAAEGAVDEYLSAALNGALERARTEGADFLQLTRQGTLPAGWTWDIELRGTLLPPAGREAQA